MLSEPLSPCCLSDPQGTRWQRAQPLQLSAVLHGGSCCCCSAVLSKLSFPNSRYTEPMPSSWNLLRFFTVWNELRAQWAKDEGVLPWLEAGGLWSAFGRKCPQVAGFRSAGSRHNVQASLRSVIEHGCALLLRQAFPPIP